MKLKSIRTSVKKVFISIPAVIEGALFCSPEKLLQSPFWGNPAVTRNNKPIKYFNFPNLFPKIKSVSDFFDVGTNKMSAKNVLEMRLGMSLEEKTYRELKYMLNVSELCTAHPFCQAQFQLASSVQVQLGTEISLIITVRPTNPPHPPG